MKTMHKTLAALAAITLSATAVAQELNQFEAGQPAVAADVNENFQLLEERIEALEQGGGTIDMLSLAGAYRFQISGAMYEFFSPDEDPDTHEEFAQREFLIVGELALNDDGTGQFDLYDDMEMQVFMQNWGELNQDIEFKDETHFELEQGAGGPDVTWDYIAADNIIDLTIVTGDGDWPIELHVSRDQNTLLGANFVQEHEHVAEYNEWLREYEAVEFTGIRLPE